MRRECGQLLNRHLICRQAIFLHRQRLIEAKQKAAAQGQQAQQSSASSAAAAGGSSSSSQAAGGGKFGRRGYGADGDAELESARSARSSGGSNYGGARAALKDSPFYGCGLSSRSSSSLFCELDQAMQLAASICAVRACATKGRVRVNVPKDYYSNSSNSSSSSSSFNGGSSGSQLEAMTGYGEWTWCGDPSAVATAAKKKKRTAAKHDALPLPTAKPMEAKGEASQARELLDQDGGGGDSISRRSDDDDDDDDEEDEDENRRGRRRRRGSEEIRREVLATFGHDAQDESGDELGHLFEEHDSKYWADDERCVQDTRSRRGLFF